MRSEALGVGPGGTRAVAYVDRDGQVAGAEVAAPRVTAGPARLARRVNAARTARQPWVEHDPLKGIQAAPDRFVTEHVRERYKRGQRIVASAVQQDLLDIGAAHAGPGRLDPHPVAGWQRKLRNVFEPGRRE